MIHDKNTSIKNETLKKPSSISSTIRRKTRGQEKLDMDTTSNTAVLYYGGAMNDFYFDELVLGGSLTALLYAYKKNLPILIDIAHVPFVLEEVPHQWDLSFLGFKKGGEHKKSQVWDSVSFLLLLCLAWFCSQITFNHLEWRMTI